MEKTPCVVLGGSFNPPTKAHRLLMEKAMSELGASHGIYVPSSDFYVSRKVSRSRTARLLAEDVRARMLESDGMSCHGTTSVSRCEYGDTTRGRTLRTLDELQVERPGMDLYFLIGDDKLDVFQRWPTAEEILRQHNLVWVGRGVDDFKFLVENSRLLSKYSSRMRYMAPPDDARDVSSSLFWRMLTDGNDGAYGLLEPDVAEILKKELEKG